MKITSIFILVFGLLLNACSPLAVVRSEEQQPTPDVEEVQVESDEGNSPNNADNLPVTPATPDIADFEGRLMMALIIRNADQLQALMGENFIIAQWRSEGMTYTADEAVTQLVNNYLGTNRPVAPSEFQGIPGFDPQSMVGPEATFAKAIMSRGWGADGKGEALLIIAQRSNGTFYWHSILVVPEGFSQPEQATCSDVEEVSAAGGVVSYRGISFTLPGDLTFGLAVITCPEVAYQAGMALDAAHPAYTSFFFPTFDRQNVDYQPELRIYEVSGDMSMYTYPLNMLGELQTAITERPEPITWFDPAPLHVHQKYLDFSNGTGIRGLVQYMQDRFFYTNNGLTYEFNGLTQDGRYFVSFRYPVTVSFLMDLASSDPASNTNPLAIAIPEWPANYEQQLPIIEAYNNEALLRFEQMGDDGAFPNLALLDALVQSLQITSP